MNYAGAILAVEQVARNADSGVVEAASEALLDLLYDLDDA